MQHVAKCCTEEGKDLLCSVLYDHIMATTKVSIGSVKYLKKSIMEEGGLEVTTTKHLKKLYLISNHHNLILTSVQVILVPYCCLFCVLSNDMLNVSIGTFSWQIYAPTSRSLKKICTSSLQQL